MCSRQTDRHTDRRVAAHCPGAGGVSELGSVGRTHHRDVVLFTVSGVGAGDALSRDGAAVLGGAGIEGVAVGREDRG